MFGVEKVNDIARVPMLFRAYTYTAPAVDTVLLSIPVTPALQCVTTTTPTEGNFDTYMSYVSRFFAGWRGSLKFRFQFVASKFTTARFRVMHVPDSVSVAPVEANAGDMVSAVVDVRGDTVFDFSVPFLSNTVYNQCAPMNALNYAKPPACTSTVQLSLVNKVVNADTGIPSIITLLIFVAAGEDMQWLQYKQFTIGKTELVFDTSLKKGFGEAFAPLVGAQACPESHFVNPDPVDSFLSLLHRYNQVRMYTTAPHMWELTPENFGSAPITADGYLSYPNIRFWSRLFLLWRGAQRVKRDGYRTGNMVETPGMWGLVGNQDLTSNGSAHGRSKIWNGATLLYDPAEFEVPFYTTVHALPLHQSSLKNIEHWDMKVVYVEVSETDVTTFYSAGEDFQFFILRAPPPLIVGAD
jgi:hypothetical protein